MQTSRLNSVALCGAMYGDEGKGKIVDQFVNDYSKKNQVVVYRDNGGANAGHTVELTDGTRIALHQLPSGVFGENTSTVLGKGMVLHPGDLLEEIKNIQKNVKQALSYKILIDEMAVLALDTHRAYELILKEWQAEGKGSTGRGISPAYADVLLRHPLRMKDLKNFDQEKITKHYQLYQALVRGLGQDIAKVKVPVLSESKYLEVGSLDDFLARLKSHAESLTAFITNVNSFIKDAWANPQIAFVFEKAQGVGLDYRWGIYPDITASDTTFDGIKYSTNGLIDPDEIEVKAFVLKATYVSSVGSRKLPTVMHDALADRIREDAREYGTTTRRPRDIAYLDLPALKYFTKVAKPNYLILTHLDICYPDEPIKVCIDYLLDGEKVTYQPDQLYLDKVTPYYQEFKPWDVKILKGAQKKEDLPYEAKEFIKFLESELSLPILMVTTGPKRDEILKFV